MEKVFKIYRVVRYCRSHFLVDLTYSRSPTRKKNTVWEKSNKHTFLMVNYFQPFKESGVPFVIVILKCKFFNAFSLIICYQLRQSKRADILANCDTFRKSCRGLRANSHKFPLNLTKGKRSNDFSLSSPEQLLWTFLCCFHTIIFVVDLSASHKH